MNTILTAQEREAADFRSSSYSGSGGGNCIQPAVNYAESHGVVLIRDSKNPDGGSLEIPNEAFASFVAFAATFEV
ncbi:DUF397 domain-containing protein [Kitasatospora sp. MAP5-34]|uniref:DUF397 domain-containing protein n=1 Tax=Kitasatospora sp. MAP5-34 TaxID=3035102 RepID=UPI0024771382|nr:DUF397 domain-containing protein [Kitasatospora sp. MAP5-34]MDH6574576.1 hypothetical protein [Kitasatospora sp. MAP5-34]